MRFGKGVVVDTTVVKRWHILKNVIDGKTSLKDASVELGVSYRQAIRMKNAVLQHGVRGLIHGNTGRKPPNALSDDSRELIVELSQREYAGLNDTCFAEQLLSRHGVSISRETVRKLRRNAGIKPIQHKRHPRTTSPARKPKEGLAVLWHALSHQWFAASPYACCLLAAIDDATGRCLAARFFPFEQSASYLLLLKEIVHVHGVPLSIIQSCSPLLKREADWSLEEQLSGEQEPTPVERALRGLDIAVIYAATKRQKRYLDRVFQELQISLVEAMQQKRIEDVNQGNRFLSDCFLADFNQRYAIHRSQVARVWKDAPAQADLERICSFYYKTTVRPNGTVVIGDVTIMLPPRWERLAHARSAVAVRQLLDGRWQVHYKNNCIAEHAPTPVVDVRSARHAKRAPSVCADQDATASSAGQESTEAV